MRYRKNYLRPHRLKYKEKNDFIKNCCIKGICIPNLKKFHQAVNEKNHFKVLCGLEKIVLRQIKICNMVFFFRQI